MENKTIPDVKMHKESIGEIKSRIANLLENENDDNRYYFFNFGDVKDFMFIMEKPHKPTEKSKGKGKNQRFVELEKQISQLQKNDPDYLDKRRELNLQELNIFLSTANDFFKEFFTLVIGTDNWSEIIKRFCFTDTSKSNNYNHFEEDEELLKIEIQTCRPKLIFVFGSMAWESIKDKYSVRPWNREVQVGNVSKSHGHLYDLVDKKTSQKVSVCLPLMFFSGSYSPNKCPRDSYFYYLVEGINNFKNGTKLTDAGKIARL